MASRKASLNNKELKASLSPGFSPNFSTLNNKELKGLLMLSTFLFAFYSK